MGKIASDGAPLAGLIPGVGTLYGASIGALGSVAAGNNRKTHLNKAIQGGLSGYANTQFLGGQGYKGIPGAFGMGGEASPLASSADMATQGGLNVPTANSGALSELGYGSAPEVSALTSTPGNLANGSGGWLSKLGTAAKENPLVTGQVLSSVGNTASSLAGQGGEDRMNDAQSRILEQRADETEYDFQQRKRREELMKPLWSVLGSGFSNTGGDVAPSPYGGR